MTKPIGYSEVARKRLLKRKRMAKGKKAVFRISREFNNGWYVRRMERVVSVSIGHNLYVLAGDIVTFEGVE